MSLTIVERCLTIVEVLAGHRQGMGLGEIAEKAGIPKSATHRMLTALCDLGYAVQLNNRDYRLTLRLPGLGLGFLSDTGIMQECQPTLDALAQEVGELVRLSVVENEGLIWLGKAQGARGGLLVDPVMGRRVVLHATATGKIWLSSLSTEDALRIVFRDGFGSPGEHGPNVVQTVEALLAELSRTAERGYGVAQQEAEPGISAVAVGIRDARGARIVATLSVAGPSARLKPTRLAEIAPLLHRSARQLEGMENLPGFRALPPDAASF